MATIIDNYARFFLHQKNEIIKDYNRIRQEPLRRLLHDSELLLVRIVRVNPSNGHVILEMDRHFSVRLKTFKSCTLLTRKCFVDLGEDYTRWNLSLDEFNNTEHTDWHRGISDILPLYFLESPSPDKSLLGCSALDLKLYSDIEKLLAMGKTLHMLLFDPFPPTAYLDNLAAYTLKHSDHPFFRVGEGRSYEDWKPVELAYNPADPTAIPRTVGAEIEKSGCCILQGPPGTGKSYTIAHIVADYLDKGLSVCVTTMANKGLVELAGQSPLKGHLQAGHVFKTNLSADEARMVPGLKYAKSNLEVPKGSLVCATYYVLSGQFSDGAGDSLPLPQFDLMVIEEASQAFLSTLAAFTSLGSRYLIVGDPMQLPPIVTNLDKSYAEYALWKVAHQYEGLMNVALYRQIPSYRINTTFRLTPQSAALTGVFYGKGFRSVQPVPVDFSRINSPLFPAQGRPIVAFTGPSDNAICSRKAVELIRQVVDLLAATYPDAELAVVSPFRDTVKWLQKWFYTGKQNLDLTIDTIDRVQGMNVDYCIVYFPKNAATFALAENRFNVATSRSKHTTLILSDIDFRVFPALPPRTVAFLSRCPVVNPEPVGTMGYLPEPLSSERAETASEGPKIVGKIDLARFERKRTEIRPDIPNYYVIDTNVFVDCPDIISRIDRQYPVVVAAKVADELDKMKVKLDASGKKHAEQAIRNINRQMGLRDVRMELSDASLLPGDFDRRSPDNLILSVALKFKKGNPIVLTSDNGLQVKAKGLGLTTLSLKTFLSKPK